MIGDLVLKLFFLGFFINSLDGLNLANPVVNPKYQRVEEYNNVIIDCVSRENVGVSWARLGNLPFSKQTSQFNGRLYIFNITSGDAGYYVCISSNNNFMARALVDVIKRVPPTTSVEFSSKTSFPFFETEVTQTTENPFASFSTTTHTPYPCLYGKCNGTCCQKDSTETFFDCANGQKIYKSLVCNRENDCDDGSDESTCSPWPPKITVLPKHKVELFCNDQNKAESGTLILECESVGHPTPLIRWKKYEGHVPTKCQQYSKRGYGILTCPNFQQSDQGAYSCVAENSVKSAESQPKSLAKCSNSINCKGFKVVNEEQIEHCLECYCSEKTTTCHNIKSNLTVIGFPFPDSQTEIFAEEKGDIILIPTKTVFSPSPARQLTQKISYCTLSESDFKERSFLKSFGRNLIIPRHKGKTDFLAKAPDLIIRGNGLSLMYTASLILPSKDNMMDIFVRFWPGNWHHLNRRPASRKDLMKVLANVDSLFIRCEYEEGKTVSWGKNTTVFLESSVITNFTNSVSYLEKCSCPLGYEGLSCETCASGYTKKLRGNNFVCEPTYVSPRCNEGYKGVNCSDCDSIKGYSKKGNICVKTSCHPEGSIFVPEFPGNCTCKEGVTGDLCDQCANGFFHLHKAKGCLKCWCSGLTNQCKSSDLYRTVISNIPRGGYNSSDGRNFWLLPSEFSGNRLTSYGGYLNYTMKYKPNISKENSYLTVEFLSADDVTLIYTHSYVDRSFSNEEKSWFVPLTETNWRKSDRSLVTRGEFLTVLSKIKAIYIESPYHLSSGQANLTTARMSSAGSSADDGTDLALEVEQCSCPEGYTGLSCESCSQGYYRKRNGTIFQCIKCNCVYCDPELGCQDCPELTYRDNSEEEKIPVCKPCPCNGNGVSCLKDDYNQIFCRCKSGFTGMHCEILVQSEKDELTVTISPRRIRGKKVGNIVHLNCSLFSNEEMKLSAAKRYKNSVQSESQISYNGSGIVTTEGSDMSKNFEVVLDVGLEAIECFVHDAQGNLAGHVVALVEDLITVIKPVQITNCYSDRIDLKESESKDLICEATGSPVPTANWYKARNGLSAIKVDTIEGVHTIESVSLNDNGTIYICIAENSEGDKATCTKVLIVRKKCEVINIFPKSVRVEEGKNISVQCKTTAKTTPVWHILDPLSGRENWIFSNRTSVKSGFLHIANATVSDSGTYMCTAEGENGKINKTISIIVEEKKVFPTVNILEYDKTLKVGDNFEVHCTATGKPTPTVTWVKVNGSLENNIIVTGKTLAITKATVQNSGIYSCKARSSLGQAFSYISIAVENKISPKINISEASITAHEGDEVSINCLALGYPRPKLSWFASIPFTKTLRENDMVIIEPWQAAKEEINFKVYKGMDGVTIKCLAENSEGKAEAETKIQILQSKDAINETVEFVPIGSYFELICEFSGEINWEKRPGYLVGDECNIPNGLMIPSVQSQHNGTYICRDTSESKKIINLFVVGFVPKFLKASRSYLVLPVHLKSNADFRIELSFNPSSENGLLLQKGNNGLEIYLKEGKIHLGINCSESNSLVIAMNSTIKRGSWYSMVVSISGNFVDITVYDEAAGIYDRKTKHFRDFKDNLVFTDDKFFVGGPTTNTRHHRSQFFRYHHFDGCISRLNIGHHEFDIIKESIYSQNVTLCRRCSEGNLCSEKGKCLDAPTQYGFICVCPNDPESKNATCAASCAGRGCETKLDLCSILKPCTGGFLHRCANKMYYLQCECAYGYSGATCEKVQEYSFCSNGTGYVILPSNLLKRNLEFPEVIKMSFTLFQPDGQLLWQGNKANYLSISVREGKLRYVYFNQNSKLEIHGAKKLEINKKHSFLVKRFNNTVSLEFNWPNQVDATQEVNKNYTSKINTNRVTGDIYLGNIPNPEFYPGHHGLNGCIHNIALGGKSHINLPEKELGRFNAFLPQKLYRNNYYDSDESDYDLDSNYNFEK